MVSLLTQRPASRGTGNSGPNGTTWPCLRSCPSRMAEELLRRCDSSRHTYRSKRRPNTLPRSKHWTRKELSPSPAPVLLLESLPVDDWAIVTSATRDLAIARLKSQGLPVPRIIVTAEDVINGKPDPEPFLLAANKLGVPAEQCVVIEDSPAGIAAANAAGMCSLAVAFTHPWYQLTAATAIARQLADIRVTQSQIQRLIIHVNPDSG